MFAVVRDYQPDVLVDASDYEIDEDGDLVFWDEMDDGELVESGRFCAGTFVGVHTVELIDEGEDEDELAE